MKNKILLVAISILTLVLIKVEIAYSKPAYMLDVVRSENLNSELEVSAWLRGAFTDKIIKTIDSGTPVMFSYSIYLNSKRSLLWDQKVKKLFIKKMSIYNPLRKKYLTWEKSGPIQSAINFDSELAYYNAMGTSTDSRSKDKVTDPVNEQKVAKGLEIEKFEALKVWMNTIKKIPIAKIDALEQDKVHYFTVKCEMSAIELPLPFNYILFFLKFFSFKTDLTHSAPFLPGGAKNIGL
ncbi:MAG: DUF4390 domain-containing protein [Nitrospinota bacterium]